MSGENTAVISTIIQVDTVYSEGDIGLVLLLPLPLDSLAILAQIKIKQGGGFPRTVRAAFKGDLTALGYDFVVGKDPPRKYICKIYKMTQTLFLRKAEQKAEKCLPDPNLTGRLAAHSIREKT